MKKSILIWMCIILCLLAAGCANSSVTGGGKKAEAADATQEPQAADDVPTLPPDEAIKTVLAPADYEYAHLSSESGKFALDYPVHWTQIPGTNTICFVAPDGAEGVVARFAFTKKTLEKAPDPNKKTSELASFVKRVVAGFDSYEYSPLNTDGSFLGDKSAYYVTYTVQKDGATFKGYVIMATRDKTLYVYHFRANIVDYEAYNPVMTRIRDSIRQN